MILELDCGNSFIKWRVLDAEAPVGGGIADSPEGVILEILACPELSITRCRMVSVRSDVETSHLVAAITSEFSVEVVCVAPASILAGVTNGYKDFERLGLDRWLTIVGGYKLAGGPCLVLDLGTAVTADFVDSDGQHKGGLFARVYRLCAINCKLTHDASGMTLHRRKVHCRIWSQLVRQLKRWSGVVC